MPLSRFASKAGKKQLGTHQNTKLAGLFWLTVFYCYCITFFSLKGFFHVPNKLLFSFLFFKKFFLILPGFFFFFLNSVTQHSLEISKNHVVILWLLIRIHLNQNKINSARTGTKSHPKLVFLFHRANRK